MRTKGNCARSICWELKSACKARCRGNDALPATGVIGLTALSASTANAQYAPRYGYGPSYGYGGAYARYGGAYAQSPYAGTYYSYGADRSNPSLAPNGWDQ